MRKNKLGVSSFIGEQLSGVPYPVFFDPHFPLINSKPPGTLITGSPGSGKTWLLLLLCAHASLMGKTSVILDPKGDFIALKKLEREGVLANVQIWNLSPQTDNNETTDLEKNNGVLDPITLFDNPDENVALTEFVISSLIGGELTKTQSNYLIPILKDVVASPNPNFNLVVSKLSRNQNEEVRNLGIKLGSIAGLGLAQLLFPDRRKAKAKRVSFQGGTTVVNLMGLHFPAQGSKPSTWSDDEKLSITIMSLITTLVANTMMKDISKRIFKMVVIDEAWTIMSSQKGRDLINELGLKGRSLNVALLLATQSPKHIKVDGVDISNVISTRFAFRNDSKENNKITVESMNLPQNEGWEEIGIHLETGQCLMQDSLKNIGVVQISVPYEWQAMFDTNPLALINS